MSVNALQYIPAVLTLPKPSSHRPIQRRTHPCPSGRRSWSQVSANVISIFVTDAPNLHQRRISLWPNSIFIMNVSRNAFKYLLGCVVRTCIQISGMS